MREVAEYNIELSSLTLDKREILKHSGEEFMEATLSLVPLLASLTAKGAYTVIKPEESDFIMGDKVGYAFGKAEKTALFISTLGGEAKRVLEEKRHDPFEYFMLDFLASLYAECVAEYMQERIREYAKAAGLGYSNRYSPGYCGWDVREQSKLFGFFPEYLCGITLTESCLMNPVKSVSGAIALGRDVVYREYGCRSCGENNCLYKSKL
jgi:hypothetical protein